jgi:hypothetical protein
VKFVIVNDATFVVDSSSLADDPFFQSFCQGTISIDL